MKLGEAYYCDGCGCEIQAGTHCKQCDPVSGVDDITYTFIAIPPASGSDFHAASTNDQAHEEKPAWKRWLGL